MQEGLQTVLCSCQSSQRVLGANFKIRVYETGAHFPTWCKTTKAVSVRFSSSFIALDQIFVIRSQACLGSKASKMVKANTKVQNALKLAAISDALENVLKPREVECCRR